MKTQIALLRSAIKTLLQSVRGDKCVLSICTDVSASKIVLKVCNKATGAYALTRVDGTELKEVDPITIKGTDVLLAIGDASDSEVTIKHLKETVQFSFGKAKIKIGMITGEDDLMASVLDRNDLKVFPTPFKGKELKTVLGRVAYAAAKNDVRYYLNGVNFTNQDGVLITVATDGFMLATAKSTIQCPDFMKSFIVPIATVEALGKVLTDDHDYTFALGLSDKDEAKVLSIKSESLTIMIPLVEGTFPSWKRVVPADTALAFVDLPRAAALSAASRISNVAAASDKNPRLLKCTFDGTAIIPSLKIATTNGESFELVTISELSGVISTGFTGQLLIESISAMACDPIRFGISKADQGACVMKDPSLPDDVHLIMPAKV